MGVPIGDYIWAHFVKFLLERPHKYLRILIIVLIRVAKTMQNGRVGSLGLRCAEHEMLGRRLRASVLPQGSKDPHNRFLGPKY